MCHSVLSRRPFGAGDARARERGDGPSGVPGRGDRAWVAAIRWGRGTPFFFFLLCRPLARPSRPHSSVFRRPHTGGSSLPFFPPLFSLAHTPPPSPKPLSTQPCPTRRLRSRTWSGATSCRPTHTRARAATSSKSPRCEQGVGAACRARARLSCATSTHAGATEGVRAAGGVRGAGGPGSGCDPDACVRRRHTVGTRATGCSLFSCAFRLAS